MARTLIGNVRGPVGDMPHITVGTVTYGDTPTVTIDDTDPANPVLNFVLKTSEVGVVDNLESESQVDALSANQGRILNEMLENKAEKDGYYEDMSVGSAEQLISNITEDDSTPYSFRTAGGAVDIGDREDLVYMGGGSINWGQLADPMSGTHNDIVYSVSNGKITYSGTSTSTYSIFINLVV